VERHDDCHRMPQQDRSTGGKYPKSSSTSPSFSPAGISPWQGSLADSVSVGGKRMEIWEDNLGITAILRKKACRAHHEQ
jgi:hypothetical protein